MGITKLFKLLFLLDQEHYAMTGRSVTGLAYETWKKGPAPRELWREMQDGPRDKLRDAVAVTHLTAEEDKKITRITPLRAFSGEFLTRRELGIMQRLATIYLEATADQMVDVTHLKDSPWWRTLKSKGENQPIEFDCAMDAAAKEKLAAHIADLQSSEPIA
jgi:uncharacterized phage-associated protein